MTAAASAPSTTPLPPPLARATAPATAIGIHGLVKRFGAIQALAPLDLEVGVGEVLGYLGPNGAGKTSTIRLLLAFLRPTAGRAEIFGLDTQRDTVAAHRRIGYVGGETSLWPSLTGWETLHLFSQVQGRVDPVYRDGQPRVIAGRRGDGRLGRSGRLLPPRHHIRLNGGEDSTETRLHQNSNIPIG